MGEAEKERAALLMEHRGSLPTRVQSLLAEKQQQAAAAAAADGGGAAHARGLFQRLAAEIGERQAAIAGAGPGVAAGRLDQQRDLALLAAVAGALGRRDSGGAAAR